MSTEQITSEIDKWTAPPTLYGTKLRLEPLEPAHLDDLIEALLHTPGWNAEHWGLKGKADVEEMLRLSQVRRDENMSFGFAMVEQATGKAVGISRFMNLKKPLNYLEIGGTFIGQQWQKTFVNTEAKILMLTYAFEYIGCQRVEFRVDSLNFNSQRGVLRIGAKYEGELRQASLLPDGRKRDYKVYSILDYEWPNIKKHLNWCKNKYV